MEESERLKQILVISSREHLGVDDNETGIELNEGYQYELDGAVPEIADAIAKMAIEMDSTEEFGQGSGKYFIELIKRYYERVNDITIE